MKIYGSVIRTKAKPEKEDANVSYEYYDEYNEDEFYFFYDEDVIAQGNYYTNKFCIPRMTHKI